MKNSLMLIFICFALVASAGGKSKGYKYKNINDKTKTKHGTHCPKKKFIINGRYW